jgi:hypothetical protein
MQGNESDAKEPTCPPTGLVMIEAERADPSSHHGVCAEPDLINL